MGERIEFGGRSGYLATGEGAGPALIVVGDRSGEVDHVTRVCDRFAAEGFTALAPDVHPHRGGAPRPATELDPERTARDLAGAVDFLVGHPAVRGHGVGAVGFSTGGGAALWLASLRPDQVRAVVPFDAVFGPRSAPPDWQAVTAAVEGHYAEGDDGTGPEAVRTLEEALSEKGRDVRLFLYPGTSPAFFDDTRPEVYDDDAARQAWVRTLEFLRAKLG